MLFEDTYLTVKEPSEGLFKDKGSKFLSFAFPVSSEEEIKMQLSGLRNGSAHRLRARPRASAPRAALRPRPPARGGKIQRATYQPP